MDNYLNNLTKSLVNTRDIEEFYLYLEEMAFTFGLNTVSLYEMSSKIKAKVKTEVKATSFVSFVSHKQQELIAQHTSIKIDWELLKFLNTYKGIYVQYKGNPIGQLRLREALSQQEGKGSPDLPTDWKKLCEYLNNKRKEKENSVAKVITSSHFCMILQQHLCQINWQPSTHKINELVYMAILDQILISNSHAYSHKVSMPNGVQSDLIMRLIKDSQRKSFSYSCQNNERTVLISPEILTTVNAALRVYDMPRQASELGTRIPKTWAHTLLHVKNNNKR